MGTVPSLGGLVSGNPHDATKEKDSKQQGMDRQQPSRVCYEMMPMRDESEGTRQKVGDRMERSSDRGIHMGRHQLFFVYIMSSK